MDDSSSSSHMDEESGEGSEHEFEYEIDDVDEDDAVDEDEDDGNEFEEDEEEDDDDAAVQLDLSAAFCEVLRRDRDSGMVDGMPTFVDEQARMHNSMAPTEGLVDIALGHRFGLHGAESILSNAWDVAVNGNAPSGLRVDPLAALPSRVRYIASFGAPAAFAPPTHITSDFSERVHPMLRRRRPNPDFATVTPSYRPAPGQNSHSSARNLFLASITSCEEMLSLRNLVPQCFPSAEGNRPRPSQAAPAAVGTTPDTQSMTCGTGSEIERHGTNLQAGDVTASGHSDESINPAPEQDVLATGLSTISALNSCAADMQPPARAVSSENAAMIFSRTNSDSAQLTSDAVMASTSLDTGDGGNATARASLEQNPIRRTCSTNSLSAIDAIVSGQVAALLDRPYDPLDGSDVQGSNLAFLAREGLLGSVMTERECERPPQILSLLNKHDKDEPAHVSALRQRWRYDYVTENGESYGLFSSSKSSSRERDNSSRANGNSSQRRENRPEGVDAFEDELVSRVQQLLATVKEARERVAECEERLAQEQVDDKATDDAQNESSVGDEEPAGSVSTGDDEESQQTRDADGVNASVEVVTNEDRLAEQTVPSLQSSQSVGEPSSDPDQDHVVLPEASTSDHQRRDDIGVSTSEPQQDSDADEEANQESRLAQIVEQRAAAVGVSLDAPANEDPDVVAAAVASTGIDPTFLAALPDDMRAEVLAQHFERLTSNRSAEQLGPEHSSASILNQDFLIALPPELRSEVLTQEASYRARNESSPSADAGDGERNRESDGHGPDEQTSGGTNAGAGSETDVATFLATLSQELREEILLTSGETFLASLPPDMAAEARQLRERDAGRLAGSFSQGREFAIRGRAPGVRYVRAEEERNSSEGRERLESSWAFHNDRWIRVPPSPEHEPRPVCGDESLATLVNLLCLQSSQYGKSLLYHVLSSVCKRASARKHILDLLFERLSQSLSAESSSSSGAHEDDHPVKVEVGTTAPETDPLRSCHVDDLREERRVASKAVVTRRVLELMANLCKNEKAMAEEVIAVADSTDGCENDMQSSPMTPEVSPVARLVDLLSLPLFRRSTVHQDHLLMVLSTVGNAIPSARAPVTTKRAASEDGDEIVGGQGANDTAGVNAEADGHDQSGAHEDGESGHTDEDSSAMERESDASNPELSVVKSEEVESDAESDVVIPVKFRVPALKRESIKSLTDVLLQDGLSDRMYQRVTTVLGQFGMLPFNCSIALDALSLSASQLGTSIAFTFSEFVQALAKENRSPSDGKSWLIQEFSMAASQDELKLLRLAKAISVLLKGSKEAAVLPNSDELKSDENKVDLERLQCFRGLNQLWISLDCVLSEVQNAHNMTTPSSSSSIVNVQDVEQHRATATASAVQVQNDENRGRGPRKAHSLSPLLARLSPVIESFFVYYDACDEYVSKNSHSSDYKTTDDRTVRSPRQARLSPLAASTTPMSPTASDAAPNRRSVMDRELGAFVERHRNAINAILRVNPQLLDGSFRPAIRHAHAIDFDNKKSYFRGLIRKRSSESQAATIRINVRRDRVFEDSYHQLRAHSAEEMKGRLHVQFTGEEGIDAGGVTREWYVILARQIFNPNYALFCRSAAKAATYQPNKASSINQEHLDNFRFVGRIFGKAIYDGQLLDAYFTRAFYKHILGIKPTYHDIETEDPDYYKSLCWILENDVTGIIEHTLSTEYEAFGQQTIIDLKPNGRNIPVTEENKVEYVRLITDVKLTKAIEKQISAFKEGFYELIPFDDIRMFNEVELELLTSGLPDIDVSDLKANVEYTGYNAGSPQVNWFWTAVGQMGQEDLARLVMFVTGTSKVPLEGFAALQGMNGPQKFQIHRASGEKNRLPSAHTCFNQLDLPEYESSDMLSERLLCAIRETEGFGFA